MEFQIQPIYQEVKEEQTESSVFKVVVHIIEFISGSHKILMVTCEHQPWNL